MANVYAVANGNWSAGATWNTGTIPTSADIVYANNFNVNVDTNFTILGISSTANTGITAGGTFTFNTAGVTGTVTGGTVTMNPAGTSFILITATTGTVTFSATGAMITSANVANCNMFNHSGACNFTMSCIRLTNGSTSTTPSNAMIKSSTGTLTFTGDLYSGSSSSNSLQAINSSAGTTNIFGNIVAVTSVTVYQTAGTVNITGNLTGSTGGGLAGVTAVQVVGITCNVVGNLYGSNSIGSSSWNALIATGNSVVNITGNVIGGAQSAGLGLNSTSVVNITGNVTGGSIIQGVTVNQGTLNVTGTINGGSAAGITGANVSGSGTLNHIGIAQASAFGSAISGSSPTTSTLICTGPFLRNGQIVAIASQNLKINVAYNPYFEFRKSDNTNVTYVDQATSNFPAISNVRLGTTYASGLYTGTLNVPTAAQVLAGIPIDNTTGTLLMTPAQFWNYLISNGFTAGSLGERLQNASTVATTGGQIASYNI